MEKVKIMLHESEIVLFNDLTSQVETTVVNGKIKKSQIDVPENCTFVKIISKKKKYSVLVSELKNCPSFKECDE